MREGLQAMSAGHVYFAESCKHRDVVPMKIVTSNDERIEGWCCCECGTEFAPAFATPG